MILHKKSRFLIIFILFSAVFFILGIFCGQSNFKNYKYSVINPDYITTKSVDLSPFWKVWNLLDEKYVATNNNKTEVTEQDKIWGAIKGLANSFGDPYTVFLPPVESGDFQTNINGNFEGVGMEIGIKDGILTVISPLKGSPAEFSGIKPGDKIININDQTSIDLSTDEAVKLIRGPKGSVVKIEVLREGSVLPIVFNITRAVIDIPTTKTEIIDDVFVLSLYNFNAQSKIKFNQALKEFINSKKDKLILDLRGNPGGYLEAAVDMASWFLPLGKPIVREDFGANKSEMIYRSKGYNIFNSNLKMVILIDRGSASASEILAGALQEYNIAKLVGTQSYGKGSVQELLSITDNTYLKVTVAKWLTPNGKNISEGGLTPDFEVKITENDLKTNTDPQLNKAIEILNN